MSAWWLEEDCNLPTLARHVVRRFIAVMLEGGERSERLRSAFALSNAVEIQNDAIRGVASLLAQ